MLPLLLLLFSGPAHASILGRHTPLLNDLEPCVAENVKETDHYICSDDHKVICLNGWSNPEKSCRTPVCEFLTHDQADADGDGDTGEITTKTCAHGDCVRPGTCACEVGWEGVACDECIRMPGCREGFCSEAFGCTCHNESMWTGALCDCPVCREGCKHGYCDEPGQCICDEGWKGDRCDECVTLPGCQNGGCVENPLECVCHQGWTGPLCDCPICSESCELDHGYCTNSVPNKLFECLCQPGWEGPDCDRCVKYPGCPGNATCDRPYECNCPDGMDHPLCGVRCEEGPKGSRPFHYEMSKTCIQLNLEYQARQRAEGENGDGDDGAGDDGAGDDGAGDGGAGDDGATDDGAGDNGAGDDSAGDDSAGDDEGAGSGGAADGGASDDATEADVDMSAGGDHTGGSGETTTSNNAGEDTRASGTASSSSENEIAPTNSSTAIISPPETSTTAPSSPNLSSFLDTEASGSSTSVSGGTSSAESTVTSAASSNSDAENHDPSDHNAEHSTQSANNASSGTATTVGTSTGIGTEGGATGAPDGPTIPSETAAQTPEATTATATEDDVRHSVEVNLVTQPVTETPTTPSFKDNFTQTPSQAGSTIPGSGEAQSSQDSVTTPTVVSTTLDASSTMFGDSIVTTTTEQGDRNNVEIETNAGLSTLADTGTTSGADMALITTVSASTLEEVGSSSTEQTSLPEVTLSPAHSDNEIENATTFPSSTESSAIKRDSTSGVMVVSRGSGTRSTTAAGAESPDSEEAGSFSTGAAETESELETSPATSSPAAPSPPATAADAARPSIEEEQESSTAQSGSGGGFSRSATTAGSGAATENTGGTITTEAETSKEAATEAGIVQRTTSGDSRNAAFGNDASRETTQRVNHSTESSLRDGDATTLGQSEGTRATSPGGQTGNKAITAAEVVTTESQSRGETTASSEEVSETSSEEITSSQSNEDVSSPGPDEDSSISSAEATPFSQTSEAGVSTELEGETETSSVASSPNEDENGSISGSDLGSDASSEGATANQVDTGGSTEEKSSENSRGSDATAMDGDDTSSRAETTPQVDAEETSPEPEEGTGSLNEEEDTTNSQTDETESIVNPTQSSTSGQNEGESSNAGTGEGTEEEPEFATSTQFEGAETGTRPEMGTGSSGPETTQSQADGAGASSGPQGTTATGTNENEAVNSSAMSGAGTRTGPEVLTGIQSATESSSSDIVDTDTSAGSGDAVSNFSTLKPTFDETNASPETEFAPTATDGGTLSTLEADRTISTGQDGFTPTSANDASFDRESSTSFAEALSFSTSPPSPDQESRATSRAAEDSSGSSTVEGNSASTSPAPAAVGVELVTIGGSTTTFEADVSTLPGETDGENMPTTSTESTESPSLPIGTEPAITTTGLPQGESGEPSTAASRPSADSPTTATPEAAANEVRESSAGETLDNGEDSSGGGTEGPTTRKLISTATIFDFDSARFNDGENEVVDIFGETDEEAASATTIEEDESSSMSSFVPIRDVARDEEFPGELDQTTENDGEAMTAAAAAATTVAEFITSRFSSSSPSSSATDVSDSNNSSSGNEGEEMTGMERGGISLDESGTPPAGMGGKTDKDAGWFVDQFDPLILTNDGSFQDHHGGLVKLDNEGKPLHHQLRPGVKDPDLTVISQVRRLDEVNKANVEILEEGADNSVDFQMLPDNF